MKKENEEISIKDILNIFLPKLWLIIIVAVIAAVVMGAFTALKPDTYTSTSTFLMTKTPPKNSNSTNIALSSSDIEAMQSLIEDNAKYILHSKSFCQKVCDELPGYDNISANDIRSMLSISKMGNSTCFAITTQSGDPELSIAVANKVHTLFKDTLNEKYEEYTVKIDTIDHPDMPGAPDSKGTVKDALIGFAIGALASALLVFIWSKFDVVIRNKDKIEDNFDIPILGIIPKLESDN